jgi:hypothetical protein
MGAILRFGLPKEIGHAPFYCLFDITFNKIPVAVQTPAARRLSMNSEMQAAWSQMLLNIIAENETALSSLDAFKVRGHHIHASHKLLCGV